jgi:hypothetical protein
MTKFLILVLALGTGACMQRGGDGDLATAKLAVDSSDSTEAEGNMMMATVDGADMTGAAALTADQVAVRIAANVALRWNPSGCAVVQQSGASITITYNDCTGPRGLVHVSGTLDVVVSVSSDGSIGLHGTSDDLTVNGASLVVDAEATYSISATEHTLTVHTTGSGVGAFGNTIDHEGDYTLTWDTATACGRITGDWSTEIGTRERATQADVARCAGGCPTGSITHEFRAGATVTVTFDGTATASWTTSTGRSGTFALACR